MLKKISALFVLSVFLLSMIPLAFAEEIEEAVPMLISEQVEVKETEDAEETEEADTTVAIAPARLRVRTAVREEIKDRLSDAPVLVKRDIAKAQLTQARTQYTLAKQNYVSVKESYMEHRATFLRAKEAYQECVDSDSEECQERRERIKQAAQPHLLKAADLVLKELERVKAKVEASEDLSEEEIAEIVADLDEKIQEVEDAKAVIEGLDEDSTREEINEAARTIREAWRHTKVALKKHVGRLVNARLGNIILRVEILEKKLYTTRDRLEEKGADVSELDNMMDEFSAHLDTAADKYNEARDIWSDANTPGEVDDAAKEVHALLQEAKEALKQARDMLRDVVNEIKELNRGSLETDDEDAEEEEEENDEEPSEDEEDEEEEEEA
jgi:hypothetical protein